MLVTRTVWADECRRRRLAESVQAWRCVGWTDETLNFWVVSLDVQPHEPSGWLVDGPETLLEVAEELGPGTFAVYVIDRPTNGTARLCQVTGLWREGRTAEDASGFWYANDAGELRPCSPAQLPPSDQLQPVVRLVPDGQIGASCARI